MKKIVVIVFFVYMLFPCAAQVNRALLVGIEDYPTESGWNKIHAHNDLDLVRAALISNGVLPKNIIELRDENATLSSIRKAFQSLSKVARSGDNVIVFFSCHGQRITDLNGDDPDGLDEALIPFDALMEYGQRGYKGENHLVDDEINALLHSITNRITPRGHLLLLLDACHSGDGDRDVYSEDAQEYYRGVDKDFIIPMHNKHNSGMTSMPDRPWTSISACKDYQTNYEIAINGRYYGRLAYAFCQCWNMGLSDAELIESIQRYYESLPATPRGFKQVLDYYCPEND